MVVDANQTETTDETVFVPFTMSVHGCAFSVSDLIQEMLGRWQARWRGTCVHVRTVATIYGMYIYGYVGPFIVHVSSSVPIELSSLFFFR